MTRPIATLAYTTLKDWLSTPAVWLVFGAALVPFVLTTAWVTTHQADLAAESVGVEPAQPVEGSPVTVTGTVANRGDVPVGEFNATVIVWSQDQLELALRGERFTQRGQRVGPELTRSQRVGPLEPGEEITVREQWNGTRFGVFVAFLVVDSDGEVPEIIDMTPRRQRDRFDIGNIIQRSTGQTGRTNNVAQHRFFPEFTELSPAQRPAPQPRLYGNLSSNRTVDAEVTDLSVPEGPLEGTQPTQVSVNVTNRNVSGVNATLTNATVTLQSQTVVQSAGCPRARPLVERVTLDPGETTQVNWTWSSCPGKFWIRAWVSVPDANRDIDEENNYAAEPVVVQFTVNETVLNPPQEQGSEPDASESLADFYDLILGDVHLGLVLPFVALFFAGGVIRDEIRQGSLVYLLTRPLKRWMLPVAKFGSGYAVASLAAVLGVVASFSVVFGTPAGNVGFLIVPVVTVLLALLVYGAFFILLGVSVDRPYLVGVVFVVGWEAIAGNFVPWVENLTISEHLIRIFESWPRDQGLVLVPDGTGLREIAILLLATAGFLVAAAAVMRHREFDV